MLPVIHWFRSDLRLADNAALLLACSKGAPLLPVYCHDPRDDAQTRWGFLRVGPHRRRFQSDTLADLRLRLLERGSALIELCGKASDSLPALAQAVGAKTFTCEAIAAPEELAEVEALRAAGLSMETVWQSSLLATASLPFKIAAEPYEPSTGLPAFFTPFRQAIERAGLVPPLPLPAPLSLPPPLATPSSGNASTGPQASPPPTETCSSFPYWKPEYAGGETAALAHLRGYLARRQPHTYKATRNQLSGTSFSSKLSPWLATGALSARTAYAALKQFEAEQGANEGTYWLWFELLWRDYFRFLHLEHGSRLYAAGGLSGAPVPAHDAAAFAGWCRGETGEPLVDAGMRELAATGYLSNRLRQVVASFLIYDLACDWRAGAAWFEAQLVDYDVYSNQGNWLYLAGRGTDPRGGRRFNPRKQAEEHDPAGRYRSMWLGREIA